MVFEDPFKKDARLFVRLFALLSRPLPSIVLRRMRWAARTVARPTQAMRCRSCAPIVLDMWGDCRRQNLKAPPWISSRLFWRAVRRRPVFSDVSDETFKGVFLGVSLLFPARSISRTLRLTILQARPERMFRSARILFCLAIDIAM